MMTRTQPTEYRYVHNSLAAICWLEVYKSSTHAVIVVSEHPDNCGPSVTNSIETIVSKVEKLPPIAKRVTKWIDRCEATGEEILSEISLDKHYRNPEWKRISYQTFRQLICSRA